MVCIVDRISESVVKEQNVLNGLTTLLRKDVRSLVVVGSFGNSVTSTSRRILKEVRVNKNCKSHECRFTEVQRIVDENTIIFVYGWFGFWNDDLCSVAAVREACHKLERLLNDTQTVKLIIGMRSDLYREYHQVLKEYTDLFQHEINLDAANVHKDAEYLKYFKERIKYPCEKRECSCEQLTFEMFRKGKDKVIGMPLKSISYNIFMN